MLMSFLFTFDFTPIAFFFSLSSFGDLFSAIYIPLLFFLQLFGGRLVRYAEDTFYSWYEEGNIMPGAWKGRGEGQDDLGTEYWRILIVDWKLYYTLLDYHISLSPL